jgi:hypothetical protein
MAAKAKTAKAPKKKENREPWNELIDNDELLRPGGVLLAMLAGRAQQLRHTRGEMAAHLDVTYGYIAQLASGHRQTVHISDEFARACADYLGVPRVTVLLAAGSITPLDLYEKPDEVASALPRALEYIAQDPAFGPMVPASLTARDAPADTQFFVVKLFEEARGVKLIPGMHTPEKIAESLKRIEERRVLLKKSARG